MSGPTYYDYRFRFPITGLAQALTLLAALRASGLLAGEIVPENMLGEARRDDGSVTDRGASDMSWVGSPGRAASSYTDPDTNQQVVVPAAGDPAFYYIHIRSYIAPAQLGLNPASFGMTPSDPAESAAVLGVWA